MTALIQFLWRKKIGKSLLPRRFKKSFYQGSSRTFDHLKAKVPQIPQKSFTWTKELTDTRTKDIQELGGVDRTVTLHVCKVIKYRIRFWIPCKFQVQDSGFPVSGTWIPDSIVSGFRGSLSWIMDSKSHVARFRRQNFSRLQTPKAKISEFQNPDYLTWSENSILKMIKGKVKSIWHSQASIIWTPRRQSH